MPLGGRRGRFVFVKLASPAILGHLLACGLEDRPGGRPGPARDARQEWRPQGPQALRLPEVGEGQWRVPLEEERIPAFASEQRIDPGLTTGRGDRHVIEDIAAILTGSRIARRLFEHLCRQGEIRPDQADERDPGPLRHFAGVGSFVCLGKGGSCVQGEIKPAGACNQSADDDG